MIKFKVLFGMTWCPIYLISTVFQSRLTHSRFTTVHGGWSIWGTWGSCSKTCGTGYRSRYRSCTAPTPKYGGRSCTGSRIQTKSCIIKHCPGKYGFDRIHTYFIYLYTVKPSVYIALKSFITITLFYKNAVWEPNRELPYSWSISFLKYLRESDFRKLMGNLFHNSAPL